MRMDNVFLPFRLTNAAISVVFDLDNHRYVASGRTGRTLAMVRCGLGDPDSLVHCSEPRGVSNLDPKWNYVDLDRFTWRELLQDSFPVKADNILGLAREVGSWSRSSVAKEQFLRATDRAILEQCLLDIRTILEDRNVEASQRFLVYELSNFITWLRMQDGTLSLSLGDQAFAATFSVTEFDLIFLCSYVNSQKSLPITEYGGVYD